MLFLIIVSACSKKDLSVQSPDGKIRTEIQLTNGNLTYQVYLRDSLLIGTSKLGVEMEDENFSGKLMMESVSDAKEIKDEFTLHHGKRKLNSYSANERTFHLSNEGVSCCLFLNMARVENFKCCKSNIRIILSV